MPNERVEPVNTIVSVWEAKQQDARYSEERERSLSHPPAEVTVRYVYPMKPSNTISTLPVTTSECTITFYKGRMKCQNWFERGGLRYKWAAKVAILFEWPFIRCPWIISRRRGKSWRNMKKEWAAIVSVSGDRMWNIKNGGKNCKNNGTRAQRQESKKKKGTCRNARGVV